MQDERRRNQRARDPRTGQTVRDDDDASPIGLAARAELFGSILQEVHEETNAPLGSLSEPLLIGAMCDSALKPDLLFLVDCSLDAAGVRAAYAAGAKEGWESDRLAFWPAARLAECERSLTPRPPLHG